MRDGTEWHTTIASIKNKERTKTHSLRLVVLEFVAIHPPPPPDISSSHEQLIQIGSLIKT